MKKEINQKIISDKNLLIQHIINTNNNLKIYTKLTQEQKEKLFSFILSNLKPEENLEKSNKDKQSINEYNKQFDQKIDYNIEEIDNLAFCKFNNIKQNISEIDNKRKFTFCGKKRKNSSDIILNMNSNKIFNIKKDINHKKSMEISKTNDNIIMNNLSLKNNYEDKIQYNFNKINNINNNYAINNNNINNSSVVNNENITNKSTNYINYFGNSNYMIQNNYYNIINNFNVNNIDNTYLNNDSFNYNINNSNNKSINYNNIKSKERINKNNSEMMDFEKNVNSKYIFDNYTFLNNENFFSQLNKNEYEQNDPFNLKFENETAYNDHIFMNDNIYLNYSEEEHDNEIGDYEFNIDKINYCDKPYDD